VGSLCLSAGARGRRHAPAHHGQLALGASVAHHRRRIVREHTRHRRQVSYVAVHDAEKRGDGGLVGGDAVEVADVDGPPLVRMIADV
jgi:hypothetical protein